MLTSTTQTALDRAKAAVAQSSIVALMRSAGVTDPEALRIAGTADLQISCLRTQLEAKGVQLDIARRARK